MTALRSVSDDGVGAAQDGPPDRRSLVQVGDSNIDSAIIVKIGGCRAPGNVPFEVGQPGFPLKVARDAGPLN